MYQHLYVVDTALLLLITLAIGALTWFGIPFAWWMVPTAVAFAALWDTAWHQIAHRNDNVNWKNIVCVNVPMVLVVIYALGPFVKEGTVNFFWWQTLIVVAGCCLYSFAWHGRDHHSFSKTRFKTFAFSGAIVLCGGMLAGAPF